MVARLVDMGIWIMRHPREVAVFVIVAWSVASVIAGIVLWSWARRDTQAPKAPGLNHRRVS
ncbi:MAG: hypothetical protein Q8O42_09705 [Acidobacteriota bacterium]|nr:hypothetical protein [Acidobacteriota bacterium]